MSAIKINVDESFKDLGDELLRKLAALNPRHPLLSQVDFTSYQARFLMLHDAVKASEVTTADLSPVEANKEYHRTLKWFPNRSAALRMGAAFLHQCEASKALTDNPSAKAEAKRLRDLFTKTMAQGPYYDPFVCLIIITTLSSFLNLGPGPVFMLVNLLLERRAPAYVYTLFNWAFALPDIDQKRFWVGAVNNVLSLSPFELANGAAINAAAFPIMPNWPGLEEVNRALLGNVPLVGAGSEATAASAPPPPNTYPPSAFGGGQQMRVKAGPLLSSLFQSPLTGSGYTVPVTDGCVDLTVVESHFATLKADSDAMKTKIEALNRRINDLQSRLSRAGADLSTKNKGKLGIRGAGEVD